ncbi:MAG: hypothetical protein H6907_17680 [Hyphomicrobiales bacterium]|nr:hypothetical protein [Hyphomicrobiales bacterium]MCP5373563.1 hypothetical protein [Hyphomicrobiales bacterium]
MTLAIQDAEAVLRARLGEPAKPPTDYVIGFLTPAGKVLAIHREASETRIWFQPPAPPDLDGIVFMDSPSNGNSNLNGPLQPLRGSTTLRVEVDSPDALNRFLDWYLASGPWYSDRPHSVVPAISGFDAAYRRFQELITAKSGDPFRGFDEGLAAVWENYKPRLRDHARAFLDTELWSEVEVGSGEILKRTIDAIEIQDNRLNLTNNLVFWQNRYGHANRDHRLLLEAVNNEKLRAEIEKLLFDLYRGGTEEGDAFEQLSGLTGGKYPLLAYLFFLKDMDRFMPIQPTGFDRAFRTLGIEFSTLRQCNWDNYVTYNATLEALRPLIAEAASLEHVELVDAHSFCWIFSSLIKEETRGGLAGMPSRKDEGRVLGSREKSIVAMRYSVENTVRNANGQIVERTVKNKDLRMTSAELEQHIYYLLDFQGNCCALTGIPFDFLGPESDKSLLPSLDRIDSNGHYEAGNLQVVCQFINFWKSDSENEEFKRLLMLVRGEETAG